MAGSWFRAPLNAIVLLWGVLLITSCDDAATPMPTATPPLTLMVVTVSEREIVGEA